MDPTVGIHCNNLDGKALGSSVSDVSVVHEDTGNGFEGGGGGKLCYKRHQYGTELERHKLRFSKVRIKYR